MRKNISYKKIVLRENNVYMRCGTCKIKAEIQKEAKLILRS